MSYMVYVYLRGESIMLEETFSLQRLLYNKFIHTILIYVTIVESFILIFLR